jgi:sugar/nucleoside kinase (ribokinase family)
LTAHDDNRPRILCAGIVVLDEVFRVEHTPARDSKVDASDYIVVGGGCAANAAVAIARLGGRASFAGPLGDDETADRVLANLAQENVDGSGCVRMPGVRSSVSAILVDSGGARTIATYTDKKLLTIAPENVPALVMEADVVLIDNRRPRFVAPVCAAARARGVPVVLDVDKATQPDDPLLASATHAIFSSESLRETTEINALSAGLVQIYSRLKSFVAVTDGINGVFWCDAGTVNAAPAFKVETVDTLAAGDVFHGAFALALAEGLGPEAAIRFSSAAAALKCQRFGGSATAPSRQEVDAFLREQGVSPTRLTQ